MSLIHCPECRREISDQAKACIHCGYPLSQPPPSGNTVCSIDGIPFDFSEMLEIYHNQGRTQSVRSFNETMSAIEKALGKDKHKQLRVYLLHYITEHGFVPAQVIRSQIPRQNPDDALGIGKQWMELDSSGPLRCPKCGSTDIHQLEGGGSIIWNFIGTGAPRNICGKCGHKFRP